MLQLIATGGLLKSIQNYADAFNNMGIALAEKGDFDASISSYNQALRSTLAYLKPIIIWG